MLGIGSFLVENLFLSSYHLREVCVIFYICSQCRYVEKYCRTRSILIIKMAWLVFINGEIYSYPLII